MTGLTVDRSSECPQIHPPILQCTKQSQAHPQQRPASQQQSFGSADCILQLRRLWLSAIKQIRRLHTTLINSAASLRKSWSLILVPMMPYLHISILMEPLHTPTRHALHHRTPMSAAALAIHGAYPAMIFTAFVASDASYSSTHHRSLQEVYSSTPGKC